MRKVWTRFFLLCLTCMICMQGLCLAGNGSWVEFYRSSDGGSIYFVDTGSIKTVEWSGRKYLEALFIQDIIALPIKVQEEISVVFDIEQPKCVELQIVHIDRGYRMVNQSTKSALLRLFSSASTPSRTPTARSSSLKSLKT